MGTGLFLYTVRVKITKLYGRQRNLYTTTIALHITAKPDKTTKGTGAYMARIFDDSVEDEKSKVKKDGLIYQQRNDTDYKAEYERFDLRPTLFVVESKLPIFITMIMKSGEKIMSLFVLI